MGVPGQEALSAIEAPDSITAHLSAVVGILSDQNTQAPPVDLKPAAITATVHTTKYALGKGEGFPTERRPVQRQLSTEPMEITEAWFNASGITIGEMADTPQRVRKTKQLLYTWKDCFATSVRDIQATDLIEHSIDLQPNAKPVKSSLPRYTQEEKEFANRIFPELEDAGIIIRRSSEWGARTKFPPKKKDSPLKRVVHNFIPVNTWTVKSGYPMHLLEDVIETIITPRFTVYFTSDASNGYWAVPMRRSDINKTGFITPNGQWVYCRMGQGLKGAPFTYAQFGDIVFGPLPPNSNGVPRMPTEIGQFDDHAFQIFVDDHAASATDFDSMFTFLHERYFPRVAFGPIYLSGHKTSIFGSNLELLGFQGNAEGLRPSLKHREKIRNWPIPTNRIELDAFLWLTPFLRIFIPGRAGHVMAMKEAYLDLIPAEPKLKRPHDDQVEPCDEDLIKARYSAPKAKKPTIQRKYVEREHFMWGSEQQESFDAVKRAISENAMSGGDPLQQYHLSVDASIEGIGGCLFQLRGVPTGTEATPKFLDNERIVMFMSFRLTDAETRYVNSERECLAVVRCLAEVRWMVIGNKSPVFIYSDHDALKGILNKGQTEKGRISNWLDRLGEYDYHLCYRSSQDQHIGIADGLSRMPTRLTTVPKKEDQERIAMAITTEQQSWPRRIAEQVEDRMARYSQSPMYHELVDYLRGGEEAMNELGLSRNRKKYLRKRAQSYVWPEPHEPQILKFIEATGARSTCLIEEEIPRFLHAAHEDHGHFASALTLDFLMGRAYWPTRVKDVHAWCQSCHSCQLRAKKPIKMKAQPIIHFEPMSMGGMDWIGPISPPCSITGARYILLYLDYFTRFVWAKAYLRHGAIEVIDLFDNHLTPIFGWPWGVYSDNGSHFVNREVRRMFMEHGVSHFTGPISHPASTGLLERAVQEMMTFLSKKCIERGTTDGWSLTVREGALDINTKSVRIHAYTPAQLMLGYEPQLYHFDSTPAPVPSPEEAEEEVPAHQYQIFTALRDENKRLSSEAASYTHYQRGQKERKQKLPNPGDLVIVRNHSVDAQKGRKLEAKWLGPRLLTRVTTHGRSAYVREIHGTGEGKRYHLDDIMLYQQRAPVFVAAGVTLVSSDTGTTPVAISANRIPVGRRGGRALLLSAR